jgi:hypothetical protein
MSYEKSKVPKFIQSQSPDRRSLVEFRGEQAMIVAVLFLCVDLTDHLLLQSR